jgi:hypothetical protein
VSLRDTNPERKLNRIYVMNADAGSDVSEITDIDAWYSEPDWGTNTSSPDDGGADNNNKHDDDDDKNGKKCDNKHLEKHGKDKAKEKKKC